MTYILWTDSRVVRVPDAWTAFSVDGHACQRRADGEIVRHLGTQWRVLDTSPVRIGQVLGEQKSQREVA